MHAVIPKVVSTGLFRVTHVAAVSTGLFVSALQCLRSLVMAYSVVTHSPLILPACLLPAPRSGQHTHSICICINIYNNSKCCISGPPADRHTQNPRDRHRAFFSRDIIIPNIKQPKVTISGFIKSNDSIAPNAQ
jgi:hypothetical protein